MKLTKDSSRIRLSCVCGYQRAAWPTTLVGEMVVFMIWRWPYFLGSGAMDIGAVIIRGMFSKPPLTFFNSSKAKGNKFGLWSSSPISCTHLPLKHCYQGPGATKVEFHLPSLLLMSFFSSRSIFLFICYDLLHLLLILPMNAFIFFSTCPL